MFWRKKPERKPPSPAQGLLHIGADGRPRPPRFEGLFNPDNATQSQRLACIEWAIAWTKTTDVSASALMALFEDAYTGKYISKKTPGRAALFMAMRALRFAGHRNRMERTARSLPWAQFRLGPQETPCSCAAALDKTTVTVRPGFDIPLVGCDQVECMCWVQQLTTRQKEAIGE